MTNKTSGELDAEAKKAYFNGKVNDEIEIYEKLKAYFIAGYRANQCGLIKKSIDNFNKIDKDLSQKIIQSIFNNKIIAKEDIYLNEKIFTKLSPNLNEIVKELTENKHSIKKN